MDALQVFSYNNSLVSFKDENGQVFINATEMAKPFGKRPAEYLRLPATINLITALEKRNEPMGKSHTLVDTINGIGTWMHEDVALDFAQWLSIDFKIWCNDRIKELMRHGITASDNMINQMLDDPDMMIGLLTKLKEERANNAIQAEKIQQQQFTIEMQAPKVAFANAVATSDKSCLVGELATILNQNGLKFGQNRLFAWLRTNGYLCITGERYNLPTQRAMDAELFEIKKTSITKPNGTVLVTNTPKVTGKGQIYFVNKLLKENTK